MNCNQVDYINPVYGTTMSRFQSISIEKDKKLPPDIEVRMLRAKYTIDLAAVTLFNFCTTPSGSLIVPWYLLYHKNLRRNCSVSGTFNPVSHATFLLQKFNPHLVFTSEEVLTQIVKTHTGLVIQTSEPNNESFGSFARTLQSCIQSDVFVCSSLIKLVCSFLLKIVCSFLHREPRRVPRLQYCTLKCTERLKSLLPRSKAAI
jgi:hypothetical protein